MIYHRMDETELLLQTDLRLVPCDVDGYYLVQGLEAQSVFQVGSLKAPSSSLNIGNLMQMRMIIYGGKCFLDYFTRC